jgi:glycine hydroxymethyltransferase
MVPFDTKSPFVTSGIRLGTAAVTTRGMDENDMRVIADYINEALISKDDDQKLGFIKVAVNAYMKDKPLFMANV